MKYTDKEIAGKIIDFFLGNCTIEDKKWLDRWVATDSQNERIFREYLKLCNYVMISADAASREELHKRVLGKAKSKSRSHRLRKRIIASIGAAVILAAGFFTFFGNDPDNSFRHLSSGSAKAILIVGNTEIELPGRVNIKIDQGIVLNADDGSQIYSANETDVLHRLYVPRGDEFDLTLEDGTRIRLNSESELLFPVRFTGAQRTVSLKGEAFFKVAENPDKPFVVSLSEGDITVYGTQFNVSDYAGYPLSAVLVEGSIGFRSDTGESVILDPSQRMVYDRETGEIVLETVNTSIYTSWTRNMFIFEGQTLEEIMTTLSRWYDVQIVFESEDIKNLTLSGRLNRDQDIRTLLDAYKEIADIDFRIKDNTIRISRDKR